MIEIDIASEVPANLNVAPMDQLVAVLNKSELKLPTGRINLAFMDDDAIQAANREYAGNDYATDVLSFSYIEDGGEAISGTLGDMMISLETANRQASQAKTDLGTEVALLTLHGVLHIVGYDHSELAEREALDALQASLMQAAGLVYRNFAWTS